jgi:hypothetical protein
MAHCGSFSEIRVNALAHLLVLEGMQQRNRTVDTRGLIGAAGSHEMDRADFFFRQRVVMVFL